MPRRSQYVGGLRMNGWRRGVAVGLVAAAMLAIAAPGRAAREAIEPAPRVPQLRVHVKKKDTVLKVAKLDARVLIDGRTAQTTVTLAFQSTLKTVLDGELVFPLPEGAVLRNYGLDIDGRIVDGVVVERDKARVSYETEVRKGIDPGLVEQVTGNNFRTRVWPIPAEGTRTVRVTYVEPLVISAGQTSYTLPMSFGQIDGPMTLLVEVRGDAAVNRGVPVVVSGGPEGLAFDKAQRGYVAEARLEHPDAMRDLVINIPDTRQPIARVERYRGDTYFTIDMFPVPPRDDADAPQVPHRIAIAWDASLSRADEDHTRELAVVASLLKRIGPDVTVDLYEVRDRVSPPREFTDGEALMNHLRDMIYDGGTDLAKLSFVGDRYAWWLVVTDGLSNLSDGQPTRFDATVFTLSSSPRANHPLLRYIASRGRGAYINLGRMSDAEAVAVIGHQPFAFLGAEVAGDKLVEDLTSGGDAAVHGRFTLAGRLIGDEAKVTLKFGRGGEVTQRITQVVRRADAADRDDLVAYTWASMRVAEMSVMPDEYREPLIDLGKRFGVVTPHTSLIVLERLEQYLEHRIRPSDAQPELRKAYDAAIGDLIAQEKDDAASRLDAVVQAWNERVKWWQTEFKVPKGFHLLSEAEAKKLIARYKNLNKAIAAENTPTAERERAKTEADAIVKELTPYLRSTGAVEAGTESASIFSEPAAPRNAEPQRPADVEAQVRELLSDSSGDRPLAATTPAPDLNLAATRAIGGVPADAAVLPSPQSAPGGGSLFSVDSVEGGRAERRATAAFYGGASGGGGGGGGDPGADEPSRVVRVKPWNPDTPYLKAMTKAGDDKAYDTYLAQRAKHGASPAFYLDCAEHLMRHGQREMGVRVLTGALDLELDSAPLMRIVAYRLEQADELDMAIDLFSHIARMRPEEPQSHRDLALALERRAERTVAADPTGNSTPATPDHLRAMELLNKVATGSWDDRFRGIEVIALSELNALIDRVMRLPSDGTPKLPIDPRLRKSLDLDLRITLRWDADLTDIDLWVIEPTGEKCFYSNNRTMIGGSLSRDMTQGYGPEEYAVHHALPGAYAIKANYYGSSTQNVVGPATLHVEIITDFGRPTEKRRAITVRLDDVKDVIDIGSVKVGE
ncbi:MAG: DUF2135 domain-containing protein [Phycisphaera sp.]|nr:DUF2135 domain-containing protein [Phycisphaera sp.]